MLKKFASPSSEWTIAFMFLKSIIITVTVGSSICSLFLCMKSNVLEKSTNNSVALRFFKQWFNGQSESVKLWIYFPQKPFWFFLYSRFDMVEKQNMMNLNRTLSYASVILSNSKVNFLGKGEDTGFYTFHYCILLIVLHNQRSMSSNFLVFPISGYISSRPAVFRLLIFFQNNIKFFLCKLS